MDSGEQTPAVSPDKDSLKVKVALRVRPLIKRDLTDDYKIGVSVDHSNNTVA